VTIDETFAHIATLTDWHGTFEHAELTVPRRECGYCTDDAARLLVVATRHRDPSDSVQHLGRGALRFVVEAQDLNGRTRNRRSFDGRWHGAHAVEDCWGRSVWGLGTAAGGSDAGMASTAMHYFNKAVAQRSPFVRSMAFAALGAAAVLEVEATHAGALALIADAALVIGPAGADPAWPWPEQRLAYANAALAEALLAAGGALDRKDLLDEGLLLLGWLLERETLNGHLSVTPVGGAGPHDRGPRYDQQPIEVAAMADGCARALSLTGEPRWATGIAMAAAWFDGDNDAAAPMWDPVSGGGFDGLQPDGPNRNQGAESTLALISTRQRARFASTASA
jgi:hypothetical protein